MYGGITTSQCTCRKTYPCFRHLLLWQDIPGDAQPIADLASDADERLFRAIMTDPSHVLRQLLPKPKHTGYLLHPRAHGYELPVKDEHNFMSHMLYKNIYCPK